MGEELNKNNKVMTALTSSTIRGIVSTARKLSIKRDDIVALTKEDGEYILIYYEGRED